LVVARRITETERLSWLLLQVMILALASLVVVHAAPGDLVLTLLSDTLPAAKGGRCMDGSMTGYYYRKGVPDTYVVFMHGGGGCSTKGSCKAWAAEKGSSKNWQRTALGTSYGVTVSNCTSNPYFCNATAAVVPYCTGDEHAGNNTVASAKTWGYIFDGHTSFTAVIEELIKTRGLADAKRVLLTGSSAGGIGALLNLDWLANRLPNADVKGAPQAGWFFPAALPGDLPDVFPPSDYPHFATGTHGNDASAAGGGGAHLDLIDGRGLLNADCVAAQKSGEDWACGSAHKLYPHLKTPVYIIENMYDTAQIYAADGKLPKHPTKSEAATVDSYVAMYGEAMRNSTAQILNSNSSKKGGVLDGLFLASCFQHPIDFTEKISGSVTAGPQSWQLLLGDWFFEVNQFQQYHRLVEHCPTELPCNTNPVCKFSGSSPTPGPPGPPGPGPAPGPPSSGCAAQLGKDGCSTLNKTLCEACAEVHTKDLEAAGCTRKGIQQLCEAGPGPAPSPTPPTETCAACETRLCPGDSGKGKACKKCVVANSDAFEAAGCYVGGSGGRSAFCERFCGL